MERVLLRSFNVAYRVEADGEILGPSSDGKGYSLDYVIEGEVRGEKIFMKGSFPLNGNGEGKARKKLARFAGKQLDNALVRTILVHQQSRAVRKRKENSRIRHRQFY